MRDIARPRWIAAALGVLALLVAVPVMSARSADAAPPPSRERLVVNDLHTDTVDIQYVDGALELQTRVGDPPYEFHAPPDVLFQLKDIEGISRFPVPDLPEYAFLGSPGDPVWMAPETEIDELVFAGWDTESILPGVLAGDAMDLSLVEVAGPGRVEIFSSPSTGPERMLSSTDPQFRTLRQPVSAHRHANWVFSALGRYQLTFEVRATAANGAALAPARATYTWYVGGTQASDVQPDATQTALSVSPNSPSAGDPVTLSATVAPATAAGWVEFFDGTVSLGFTAVSAGQAALTTSALAGGTHSLTARYTPTYTNDHQASTSAPVVLVVSGTATPTTQPTVSPTPTASASASISPTPAPTPTTASPSPSPSPSQNTTTSTSPSPSCTPVTKTSTSTGTSTATILNVGHVDYAARLSGGQLVSQIKDGTVAGRTTWREPADVVFHLKPEGATTVPSDSEYAFLGPTGSKIWQIPHIQNPSILWLGWNTEEIDKSQLRGGSLTWSLDKVEGPGKLMIYVIVGFGQPQVVFNSGDGLPDRYTVLAGTHAHGNWAFTKEGAYKLTFTHRATRADGRTVSDTAVVTFAVGATDPNVLARQTTTRTFTYSGTSCGPLALTGTSLVGPVTLGAGLLLGGGLLVVLTIRRRRTS